MIENVTSSEKYLYHYTTATTALDHILREHALRFGSYTRTNDPKEGKAWQFDIGTNGNIDLATYNSSALSDWLSSALKDRAKLACFSTDTNGLSGDHMLDIFMRGFSKPRMWAQYAENHAGVCLVFDWAKLTEVIETKLPDRAKLLYGKVRYANRSVIPKPFDPYNQQYMINIDALEQLGEKAYAEAHLATHYQRLFLEKMEDWRDESEWRYIIFNDSKDDLYIDYEDALVGVMFGERTRKENIDHIMNATESWGLRYMGLKWKNCSPWYDYANLRYSPKIKNAPWGKNL